MGMKQKYTLPLSLQPFAQSAAALYIEFQKRMTNVSDPLGILILSNYSTANYSTASYSDKQDLLRKALLGILEIEMISQQIIDSVNETFIKEGREQAERLI